MLEVKSRFEDTFRKSGRRFVTRTTKFRHLKGTILNKEHHVKNLPTLCRTIPGECNFFKVSKKFAAIPIGRSPNQLAVLKLDGCRLECGLVPSLLCGNGSIGDFAFDPFDDHRLAVGCNDAKVKVWIIPEDGLTLNSSEPDFELIGHNDRVTVVEFHPLAIDVLTTASVDLTIKIWDLVKREVQITVNGFPKPIFGFSWHPDGHQLAVVSKDQKLKVFEPRKDAENCIKEGPGPQGTRGARVIWLNNGTQLAVIGFSRVSERQIILYSADDITKEIASHGIDVNPAILIPFYDEGSSTLFLAGKGDTTVFAFEISPTADGEPHIHALSNFNCPSPHQAVAFLPKICCDVKAVEFAKGYRLTDSTIEPVSVTVPRLRVRGIRKLIDILNNFWQPKNF